MLVIKRIRETTRKAEYDRSKARLLVILFVLLNFDVVAIQNSQKELISTLCFTIFQNSYEFLAVVNVKAKHKMRPEIIVERLKLC